MYSNILQECKMGSCRQCLVYKNDNGIGAYGFPVLYNESCLSMMFDPWSGVWISESYEESYFWALYDLAQQKKKYNRFFEIEYNKETEGPLELRGTEWLLKLFNENRKLHYGDRYCHSLETNVRYGSRCDTTLIELPAIRVVAVLNKTEYGGWTEDQFELFRRRNDYFGLEEWEFDGWTAINYCPFCGAKLPDRLDKKIIETLKNEYGLCSWISYEKAPNEFHYDEWWRKRGL